MAEIIADLKAVISADISGLQSGLKTTKDQLESASRTITSLGAAWTAGFTAPAVGGLVAVAKEAAGAESALAQLDAVLKSTSASTKDSTASTGYWVDGTKQAAALSGKYAEDLAMANARLADMNDKMAKGGQLSHVQQLNYQKLQGEIGKMTGEIDKAAASGKRWVNTQQQAVQVSHMSRAAYINLADSLAKVTRFSDEAILGAESMLLTFTKIGKDIFPQATETVLDMSQALGQDLKNSAIQLGKALNDPINGVTALRRVGVQFSDAQERMIKSLVNSGKLLDAQKLILQELQIEFGGSARAAGETFSGALDILGNSFSNLLEVIGTPIIEALKPFLSGITEIIDNVTKELGKISPEIIVITTVFIGLAAAIPPLIMLFGLLLTPIGALTAAVAGIGIAIATNFGGIASTIGEILAAVKPQLDQLAAAVGKFWSILSGEGGADFKPTVDTSGGRTAPMPKNASLKDKSVLTKQGTSFEGSVTDKLPLAERWAQAIEFALPQIEAALGALFDAMGNWITTTGWSKISNAFSGMWSKVVNAIQTEVTSNVRNSINGLLQTIGIMFTQDGVIVGGVAAMFMNAFNWIHSKGQALARLAGAAIKEGINSALSGVGSVIVTQVVAALRSLASLMSSIPGMGSIGTALDAALAAAGYAAGGYVDANRPIIIGERGAEVFVPQTAGRVLPNSVFGGSQGVGSSGGGNTITIQTLNMYGVNDIETFYDQLVMEAGRRNRTAAVAIL